MTKIELTQFKQTNLRDVLERAQELLVSLATICNDNKSRIQIAEKMLKQVDPGDDWERVAWSLVNIELVERIIREEDASLLKYPEDWDGGINVGTKE